MRGGSLTPAGNLSESLFEVALEFGYADEFEYNIACTERPREVLERIYGLMAGLNGP